VESARGLQGEGRTSRVESTRGPGSLQQTFSSGSLESTRVNRSSGTDLGLWSLLAPADVWAPIWPFTLLIHSQQLEAEITVWSRVALAPGDRRARWP
jgi:hypothetical protein